MATSVQSIIYPARAGVSAKSVAYWACTGLVAFFIGSGGLAYALQVPGVVQGAAALGFPVHFIVLLGFWKVLGSIAILVPGLPRVKEWAYAGISFDLTGAASAAIATGGEWWHAAAPLSIAVLLAASWALRPESRSCRAPHSLCSTWLGHTSIAASLEESEKRCDQSDDNCDHQNAGQARDQDDPECSQHPQDDHSEANLTQWRGQNAHRPHNCHEDQQFHERDHMRVDLEQRHVRNRHVRDLHIAEEPQHDEQNEDCQQHEGSFKPCVLFV